MRPEPALEGTSAEGVRGVARITARRSGLCKGMGCPQHSFLSRMPASPASWAVFGGCWDGRPGEGSVGSLPRRPLLSFREKPNRKSRVLPRLSPRPSPPLGPSQP